MRIGHFETLRPVCPVCRSRGGADTCLSVTIAEAQQRDEIESGIIGCPTCGAEFPVVDGMPILVPDVRRFVEENLFYLLARTDLTPAVESLLGDAAGAASGLQSIRQHVSSYVWDHWGDKDPAEKEPAPGAASPGSIVRALERGLDLLSVDLPDGPVLDLGCGPGRPVAELASRTGRMVLGIDLSIPLARAARRALVGGEVDYPRRRGGVVYDRRRFAVSAADPRLVDVWICDALALPFPPETFGLVTAMNVLDCVTRPRQALVEIDRILKLAGETLLSLPFDWTGHVTPMEEWLGGHSQRAPHEGSAEAILEMLLADGAMAAGSLRRIGTPVEVPWHVRLHNRSCMHYTAHLLAARRGMNQNTG
ncbi:methyltransferase domain-containing protein [Nitratireductor sp. GCM10026969]|uniref:methyltransferase domain-containing protein n=1 Tax=Nitratireductor sp. GCM10026969 TaxID=3252645 RepID=UPI00360878B8